MSNDCIPYFDDGDEITCTAPAGVTGSTLVKISGDLQSDGTFTIATAGAGDRVLGVAMFDAAAGKRTTVHRIISGHIVPILTNASLAANDPVKVGAGGIVVKAATAGDAAIGIVGTSANGSVTQTPAMILLERFSA